MKLLSWLRRPSRRSPLARNQTARLTLEGLERRTAPTVFVVNTFDDTVEAVRDGSGRDANGNISLRSAIMGANDLPGGEHTVVLSEGTYSLTIPPRDSNQDDSGNLNIGLGQNFVTVTLEGVGLDRTVINAGYLDQALAVGFFARATVRNLTIENGYGGFGGAVTNAGNLTLTDVVLRAGYASHGGGLFNQGTAALTNVFAYGNYAPEGGAIHSLGTLTVTTSELLYNYAGQGGGLFNAGTLTMNRSTVADNFTFDAVGMGGGIFNQAIMTLTNSTVARNGAALGGGIFTAGFGTATFLNCTVASNYAYGSPASAGGGIYVGPGTPTVQLKNTIVGYNWSERNAWDISGAVTSLGHNLVSDGTGATGFVASDLVGSSTQYLDPMLGPLDYNGGSTRTMALQVGSAAINAGDNEGAPTIDQRGETRDAFVDIGAYEFLSI